jgi:hypothetical protein
MSWHADDTSLAAYANGQIDDASAYSIEAHLVRCTVCQLRATHAANPVRLSLAWDAIADRIDAPKPGIVERGLLRLGVRDHLARLLSATPALRLPWIAAVAITLAFTVLTTIANRGQGGSVLLFLIIAPLVPLAGVATSFGPSSDPTYEVGIAAPMRASYLLLVRASATVGASILITAIAAVTVPGMGWRAVAWLLPAFALSTGSLALATAMSPITASASLAGAWVVTVGTVERWSATPLESFGAVGQVVCLIITVVSVAAIAARRTNFDIGRNP